MSAAPWSLRSTGTALAGLWNGFFHTPADGRVAALVRIAFAACVLANLSVLYPDLGRWFTAAGVLPAEASRELTTPGAWSVLWLLPDTQAAVTACYWVMIVQAVLLGVGFLPRLQAACLFIWLVSLHNRNILLLDGEDTVFRLIAFYLIWIPSGRVWSVDAWLRRSDATGVEPLDDNRDPHSVPPQYAIPGWGLRLLQVQMAVMLLATGLAKLEGETWLGGTALYYVARIQQTFDRFPIPAWPFDSPWPVALITWSVLAMELLVPLLIWFRETRRACLLAVVLFHLANEWSMHLFLFHWIMLAGWLSFLSSRDLAWVSGWFSKRRRSVEVSQPAERRPVATR